MCISGQSIRDATERLKRYPNTNNMKIIANLGTEDILQGRQLADIVQDYINFERVCRARNVGLVITTLAPIANRMCLTEDTAKRRDFNDFLKKRFSKDYQIIDISPFMMDTITGKVLYDCYQG